MKITIVEPSVEVLTPIDALEAQLKVVERAGRVCYKSEHKIHGASAEQFIRNIIQSGHESVIEHGWLSVKFIGSRAMSHQLVRHRPCVFEDLKEK